MQYAPHELNRFLSAQSEDYQVALEELKQGRKESHWIWYVFPQVAGLGLSSMSQTYAIQSKEEGLAYFQHPVLGQRLHECCEALLLHQDKSVTAIMGTPDDLKLKSSMTLFASLSDSDSIYHQVLEIFYEGEQDQKTLDFLGQD